jgi:hypothetical protein
MKIISKSEAKSLGLNKFFTGVKCVHGHLDYRSVSNGRCFTCRKIKDKENYQNNKKSISEKGKKYRESNRDELRARKKKYYEDNKDRILEERRLYVKENKEKIADRDKRYYRENKERVLSRDKDYYNKNKELTKVKSKSRYEKNKDKILESNRKYHERNRGEILEKRRDYYNSNKDKFKAYHQKNKSRILSSARDYRKKNPAWNFQRKCMERLIRNWKGGRKKAESALGYTYENLVERIEFQFKDGMSWENRSEWHIDHKKPVARFIKQGITDPKIINALSNLQPLWAKDNISKGAKY